MTPRQLAALLALQLAAELAFVFTVLRLVLW
jgi:hypothetical protein